MTEKNK